MDLSLRFHRDCHNSENLTEMIDFVVRFMIFNANYLVLRFLVCNFAVLSAKRGQETGKERMKI